MAPVAVSPAELDADVVVVSEPEEAVAEVDAPELVEEAEEAEDDAPVVYAEEPLEKGSAADDDDEISGGDENEDDVPQ